MTQIPTSPSPSEASQTPKASDSAERPAGAVPPRDRSGATIGRLAIQNVSKRFEGSNLPALADITITCNPGEFVVVVGPSGCGKSTLLNLAAGMVQPDSGQLTLDGRPISGPGPDRAMVFQEHGLFPWLTAADNIAFGLRMLGMAAKEREQRVAKALQMIHLPHSGGKLVHQLSGGMRQRIAIARALVMNPSVLLMDEPFAALDAQTRTLLHEQVQEIWLQTHKTILFVTHSVGEAVRLADRIIVLHANPGRIRREFQVNLPHPRDFDSREVGDLIRLVRQEIEDEVNRIHAELANGQ
jgi:NitT/TauT family transport system ATP-binding protein